jgi:hypothetical protein
MGKGGKYAANRKMQSYIHFSLDHQHLSLQILDCQAG